MGKTGPVPKRSSERIRRNKPEVPITMVEMVGAVVKPELGIDNPHPIIVEIWESLDGSGQSQYYEPSDWAFARYALYFANQMLHEARPNAQKVQAVNSMLGDLLLTEGSRRRVRMEVERNKTSAEIVDISAVLKERMGVS